MRFYIKKALRDIVDNRFINAVTIITIALSILIISAAALFFVNASDLFNNWKQGIRIMVYLAPDTTQAQQLDTRFRLQSISGVKQARFISKEDALSLMKNRMSRQSSLLDNLRENPLPDAFEVSLVPASSSREDIEFLARRIESLPSVDEVEYGRQWIERFSNFFNLFKITGYALGGIFLMAAVFISANTIRLMLYARREEIEIMRLVGATDRFIKTPFYIEGLIQGLAGALFGLCALYGAFIGLSSHFEQNLSAAMASIRFLPPDICGYIVLCGILTGWLGCFFSLKQFMKI